MVYKLDFEIWVRFEFHNILFGVQCKAHRQMEMVIYTGRELKRPFQ